jgi:POT family proton-dependent oligopeptide transporter
MQTASDRRFFGHPRGLLTLFGTEMWERWSFYGMRSILIAFLVAETARGGLGFAEGHATSLYHIYLALIYLASLPGGWIADRFLGLRRSVFWGGVLIMCGHVVLAIHGVATFFTGLLLVILGTGLLKPNVSAVVGALYRKDDERRDAAFSIFYMGINLGSFLGQLVAPFLAQHSAVRGFLEGHGIDARYVWQLGFGSAALGMLFGLVQYVRGQKHLGSAGERPRAGATPADWRTLKLGVGLVLLAVAVVVALVAAGRVTVQGIDDSFGTFLLLLTVAAFARLFTSGQWTPAERRRLYAIGIYFLASCFFWSAFEQAGSTLNLFAIDDTEGSFLGFEVAPGWYQNVNALCIILFSPLFAALWIRLGRRDPSHPVKFALGLLFVGLGFVVMARGAALAAGGERVSPAYLILCYVCHSIGEVCLSPVGLSAMTRLAPDRVTGLMMGIWFLSISVGSYLGGRIAHAYQGLSQQGLFGTIATLTIVSAGVMVLLAVPLKRLSASREERAPEPEPVAAREDSRGE